jgi:hypothetical protein
MPEYLGADGERRIPEATPPQHCAVALVQLIATLALALSTLIVATAVSIEFARADVAGAASARFDLAGLIGLSLVAAGGVTAFIAGDRKRRR